MTKYREPKKITWNWNAISSVGTVIASIAAIFAIYIGNQQSRESLKRTDTQNELILQERALRNEENRPLITINKNNVYGLKKNKQFKLVLENIGTRPAYDLSISNVVLSYYDNTYNLNDKSVFSFSNPVNKNQEVDFFGNIQLNGFDNYYIREMVSYTDLLTNKQYNDFFYFKWTNMKDKDFRNDVLFGIDINTKQLLDKLIENKNIMK